MIDHAIEPVAEAIMRLESWWKKVRLPPALDDLIARCLAKDPAARPQRVDELIDLFAAILREQPWTQEQAVRWWQDFSAAQELAAV